MFGTMGPFTHPRSDACCADGRLTGDLLGILCHEARFCRGVCPIELRKLAFLGMQVLDLLEANVPQTIMVKFEMTLHLCKILVAFIADILRNAD